MDQQGEFANPARSQLNKENEYFLVCPRSLLRIWSHEIGSAGPASACSFYILRLNLVLTRGIPPAFRSGVHSFIPPYAIGSVPSLSGHATTYRWRSLPRVRRHRASKPQGSYKRVLPWQVTMEQLMCAFLSHSHNWYEVSMWKVLEANMGIYLNARVVFTAQSKIKCPCRRIRGMYILVCSAVYNVTNAHFLYRYMYILARLL